LANKKQLFDFCEKWSIELFPNDTKEEILKKMAEYDLLALDLSEAEIALLKTEGLIVDNKAGETEPESEQGAGEEEPGDGDQGEEGEEEPDPEEEPEEEEPAPEDNFGNEPKQDIGERKDSSSPATEPQPKSSVPKVDPEVSKIQEEAKVAAKLGKRFFLVTDKESLNRGKLLVEPVSMVREGVMGQYGDCILPITEGIAELKFKNNFDKNATVHSLKQMDGVIELTPKAIEKIVKIGVALGVLEKG